MRLGILIATHNRPEYLKRCLNSLKKADLPKKTLVIIVDDASTNEETKRLILGFTLDGIAVVILNKPERKGIKDSLKMGFNFLFENNCSIVMNFDSDALISNIGVTEIIRLKNKYPDRIITGFHSTTKNANGTERHIILKEYDDAYEKKSVGGINMCFDYSMYESHILPALLVPVGNWDYIASTSALNNGYPIISPKKSVVEHIGFVSAMGHTSGVEKPDTADGFKLLHLPDVTLVGADCVDANRLIKAADICCKDIEFGAVKILSSLPSNDSRVIPIRHLGVKSEYSIFMMKELASFIETKNLLVFQYDGFVLNPEAWENKWLSYDYIGAPWHWYTDGMQVGNGGFSLRSKYLHDTIQADPYVVPINEEGVTRHKEEDHCIARLYRKYLEQRHNIRFAPLDEAFKFSIEAWNAKDKTWRGQFGFHGRHADISQSGYSIPK